MYVMLGCMQCTYLPTYLPYLYPRSHLQFLPMDSYDLRLLCNAAGAHPMSPRLIRPVVCRRPVSRSGEPANWLSYRGSLLTHPLFLFLRPKPSAATGTSDWPRSWHGGQHRATMRHDGGGQGGGGSHVLLPPTLPQLASCTSSGQRARSQVKIGGCERPRALGICTVRDQELAIMA